MLCNRFHYPDLDSRSVLCWATRSPEAGLLICQAERAAARGLCCALSGYPKGTARSQGPCGVVSTPHARSHCSSPEEVSSVGARLLSSTSPSNGDKGEQGFGLSLGFLPTRPCGMCPVDSLLLLPPGKGRMRAAGCPLLSSSRTCPSAAFLGAAGGSRRTRRGWGVSSPVTRSLIGSLGKDQAWLL